MSGVALYPYDAALLPVVRHFETMQKKDTLRSVMAVPGYGGIGRDAAYACNQPDIGIPVVQDTEGEAGNWEVMYLTLRHLPHMYDAKTMLRRVLQQGKQVIGIGSKNEMQQGWVKELKREIPQLQLQSTDSFLPEVKVAQEYQPIQTPVILAGGIAGREDVLEVILTLAEELRSIGKTVACITNEPVCTLLGGYDFSALYREFTELPIVITQINQTVRAIEKELLPDVILMEAPDALIRYHSLTPNGFGIYSYMLAQAVKPDYMVCCMPADMAYDELIQYFSRDFSTRYGVGIDAVHISNMLIDGSEIAHMKKMTVFYGDMQLVKPPLQRMEETSDLFAFNAVLQRGQGIAHRLFA